MLHNALLSLTALVFCLSLFLLHRASVLQKDFRKLRGDLIQQLNQPRSEGVGGTVAKMSKTRKDLKPSVFQRAPSSLKMSYRRVKREQSGCGAPTSFLQLRANTHKQPDFGGNTTAILWTVSAQRGSTISRKENRIVVQQDGYYLVFGQVLFEGSSAIAGFIIQSWRAAEAGPRPTELLYCVQKMPEELSLYTAQSANTCYTAGVVRLVPDDELELAIPHRASVLVSMDAEATFFGAIRLN